MEGAANLVIAGVIAASTMMLWSQTIGDPEKWKNLPQDLQEFRKQLVWFGWIAVILNIGVGIGVRYLP